MENLTFSIKIDAPKKKVWNTMLDLETYKQWTNAAWPGSTYIGEWKEGENIRFVSHEGSGTLATITTCTPHDHLLATHIAVLLPGGVEDRDSDMAKGWVGTAEEYTFTENHGGTELTVVMKINPEWAEMFLNDWPKALAKLKEICEIQS